MPVETMVIGVDIKPAIVRYAGVYQDPFANRNRDFDKYLLVPEFDRRAEVKPFRQVEQGILLLNGKLDITGKLSGNFAAAAPAEFDDIDVIIVVLTLEDGNPYRREHELIISQTIDRTMVAPVDIAPPIGIVVAVVCFRNIYDQFAGRGLDQVKAFFGMLSGPEVIEDQANQGNGGEKTDHPERTKGITQIVGAGTDTGDP